MYLLENALKIVEEGERKGATIRLIGGLAVYYHSPSARSGELTRTYGDIDLFGLSHQTKIIKSVMEDQGYIPNKRFNALHGDRRLIYHDESGSVKVDILLDYFEMCHKIDLRDRLKIERVTIPLSDLLMTKLQIVELNEKDIKDIMALLIDHELKELDESEAIGINYIARLCSRDWGLEKTVKTTLDIVLDWAKRHVDNEAHRDSVISKVDRIKAAIDSTPKSLKWKLRALIGDKVRWYEMPEEPLR
jgi:hypothetical protein